MKDTSLVTRNKILEIALKLFSEKGYESISVQEIASLAGVTKPTLYYYFETKENLYSSIWEEYFGAFYNDLKKATEYYPNPQDYDNDVFGTLLKVVDTYFSFSKSNPVFAKLMQSLMFCPTEAESTKIVFAYQEIQITLFNDMFIEMGKMYSIFHGRETQLSITLLTMINSYIYYQEKISDITSKAIVKQFMHGIFS